MLANVRTMWWIPCSQPASSRSISAALHPSIRRRQHALSSVDHIVISVITRIMVHSQNHIATLTHDSQLNIVALSERGVGVKGRHLSCERSPHDGMLASMAILASVCCFPTTEGLERKPPYPTRTVCWAAQLSHLHGRDSILLSKAYTCHSGALYATSGV